MDSPQRDITWIVKKLIVRISYNGTPSTRGRQVKIKSLGNPLSDEKSLAILREHYAWLAARDSERNLEPIITVVTLQ
jgi:hypothetical protein